MEHSSSITWQLLLAGQQGSHALFDGVANVQVLFGYTEISLWQTSI